MVRAIADSPLLSQGYWDTQAAGFPETAGDWLLPGYLARGNMTLLTSMWKTGKTTLLAHLLARRVNGGTLLGQPVARGKTIVISEEPRALWADRCRQFHFGGQLYLFTQPFPHLPSSAQWHDLLNIVDQLRVSHGFDLLVIDSLTHFLRAENAVSGVLDLMMPVRALTAQGMAALLMHHPRRRGASAGNAGRGHGAIQSEVDISIEMRHAGVNVNSRARQFFTRSRHVSTPPQLQFELNADGTDYTVLTPNEEQSFSAYWEPLRMVLEDAPQKLTRLDILDEWPEDFPKPVMSILGELLNSSVADRHIEVEGTGRKADPFRYWARAAEERWKADPFYKYMLQQAHDLNLPFISLREQKRRETMERVVDSSSRIWPPGSPMD